MKLINLLIIGTCQVLTGCNPASLFLAEEVLHETEVAVEAVERDLEGASAPQQPPTQLPAGANAAAQPTAQRKADQTFKDGMKNARHQPKVLLCSNAKKKEALKHGC